MSALSLHAILGSVALVVVLCLAIHMSGDSRVSRTLAVLAIIGTTAYALFDIRHAILSPLQQPPSQALARIPRRRGPSTTGGGFILDIVESPVATSKEMPTAVSDLLVTNNKGHFEPGTSGAADACTCDTDLKIICTKHKAEVHWYAIAEHKPNVTTPNQKLIAAFTTKRNVEPEMLYILSSNAFSEHLSANPGGEYTKMMQYAGQPFQFARWNATEAHWFDPVSMLARTLLQFDTPNDTPNSKSTHSKSCLWQHILAIDVFVLWLRSSKTLTHAELKLTDAAAAAAGVASVADSGCLDKNRHPSTKNAKYVCQHVIAYISDLVTTQAPPVAAPAVNPGLFKTTFDAAIDAIPDQPTAPAASKTEALQIYNALFNKTDEHSKVLHDALIQTLTSHARQSAPAKK